MKAALHWAACLTRPKRCAKQRSACHNAASWSDGQWFEATFALEPMVSLVYPSVYPTEVDGNESKDWRGL